MDNFDVVHVNSNTTIEIWHSHVEFSMSFTSEIGGISQFHPNCHANSKKLTNYRPKNGTFDKQFLDILANLNFQISHFCACYEQC